MDGNRIREITNKGLTYLNDNGEESFIDFAACFQDYFKEHTSPEAWESVKELNKLTDGDLPHYLERQRERKEVGYRSLDGYPESKNPFIEFYTNPPIRFEFATQDEFQQVRHLIHKAGWKTFDIT